MKKILIILGIITLFFLLNFIYNKKEIKKTKPNAKIPTLTKEETTDDKGIKEIKDKVFVQFTNDMFYNPKGYINKKIKIEGLTMKEKYEGRNLYFIIRKTPGCCGDDGYAGLEVAYDGEIPKEGTWVTAKGIWKKTNASDNGYLLVLYSLEKTKRGNTFLNENY